MSLPAFPSLYHMTDTSRGRRRLMTWFSYSRRAGAGDPHMYYYYCLVNREESIDSYRQGQARERKGRQRGLQLISHRLGRGRQLNAALFLHANRSTQLFQLSLPLSSRNNRFPPPSESCLQVRSTNSSTLSYTEHQLFPVSV